MALISRKNIAGRSRNTEVNQLRRSRSAPNINVYISPTCCWSVRMSCSSWANEIGRWTSRALTDNLLLTEQSNLPVIISSGSLSHLVRLHHSIINSTSSCRQIVYGQAAVEFRELRVHEEILLLVVRLSDVVTNQPTNLFLAGLSSGTTARSTVDSQLMSSK